MTEEVEVYKKAFDYVCNNRAIDKEITDTIIQLENRYSLIGDPHHDNRVYDIIFKEVIFQTALKNAIDIKSKQDTVFKELEKAITENEFLINQLKKLKRDKGIAIVGNDHNLITGVVSYLWLTAPLSKGIPPKFPIWLKTPVLDNDTPLIWQLMSPIRQKFFDAIGKFINGKKGFGYINCDGVNETELHGILFSNMAIMPNLPGSMLFLRKVNNSHTNILRRVLGTMLGIGGQGNFIVSTDTLPQDLKDQFEPIYLDAEKQDTPVQGRKRNKLYYRYNEQDEVVLFFKKGESITLTKQEAKLFLFLVEDRRKPEEIIEHVWEVYKQKDIDKKKEKGNVKELRNRINNKCCKIGVENLISKLTGECYSLTVEVAEQ